MIEKLTKKYPTKEEVLANLYTPSTEETKEIERWKQAWYKRSPNYQQLTKPGWRNQPEWIKWQALADLITIICTTKEVTAPGFEHDNSEIGWRYNQTTQTIIGLRGRPSIISCLHELGHHIYGPDETQACQFSIGIFKTCFPKGFSNLKWEGHKLTT